MKAVCTSNDIIRLFFLFVNFTLFLFEIPTMLVNNLNDMQTRTDHHFVVSFSKLTELYAHVFILARTKLTN